MLPTFTMKLPLQLFVLALAPCLVFGSLFPADSHVQMLVPKSFKKAMETNETSMVAYVASSRGHCRHMASEFDQLSQKLHPLIPTYAVDCDDAKNKRLCAEKWVQALPVVTLFPRGNKVAPMISEDRVASAIFKWVSSKVPDYVTQLSKIDDIKSWGEKTKDKSTLLLLTKEKKIPLLWKVLANKYSGKLELAAHWDEVGETIRDFGLDGATKVLIYPAGHSKPIKYEGATKFEALTKFFDSILDGTGDLETANEEASNRPDDEL